MPEGPDGQPVQIEVGHSTTAIDPQHDPRMPCAAPGLSIWKNEESAILRANVAGYRAAPRKEKSRWVAKNVVPLIKAVFGETYKKKYTEKDSTLLKQWDKKKLVSRC